MAKTSKIVRNEQRQELVTRKAETRKKLKAIIKDKKSTPEQIEEAVLKLQKLPRDSSPVRVRNRCQVTGRPRAYLRKFGMSRIALREKALEGQIPGVVKSSW
jgi:small subunit ribosomal protein S14